MRGWQLVMASRGRAWVERGGALAALLLLAVLAGPTGVAAAETWRTITVGESNTEEQRAELLAYFGAEATDVVTTVTVADTQRAMAGIFDIAGIDSAYSSTALTCRAPGSGLEVTTRNIEAVTPDLFALALVTAGVEDAALVVAAPNDAPALGMTALTGVFSTLETAPCRPGGASATRQTLALEGLARAATIGQTLGGADGVARVADVVLETQRAVVALGLRDESAIATAIAEREAATGLVLPEVDRAGLVDLLTRLAGADLDWGGFAAGWTLTRGEDGNRITMVGAGPRPGAASTRPVATGVGGPLPTVVATATPSPVPSIVVPTAVASPVAASPAAGLAGEPTPPPAVASTLVSVTGTVVAGGGGRVAIQEPGGDGAVAYTVVDATDITRAGQGATVEDLRAGDRVRMTVDGTTGRVVRLEADPAASPANRNWRAPLGALAALGLIAAAAVLFARRRARGWLIGGAATAHPLSSVLRRRTWTFGRGAAGSERGEELTPQA